MRITIIPGDKAIGIDNKILSNVQQDLSWIPSNIHAVQWYDTLGEVEYNDGTPNERIEELGIYEQVVVDFNNEIKRIEDQKAAIEAAGDYWAEFRSIRDNLLWKCDWTQNPDSPLTEEKKLEWAVYRQLLRDLTQNVTDPKPMVLNLNHLSWPIPPI